MELRMEFMLCEIIEHIAQFLAVKDLLSCCSTSTRMRELFNENSIWRKRCDPDFVKYLEKSTSLVVPSIDWLDVTDLQRSTLLPLSRWRLGFMMQNRLIFNWINGRYDQEDIEYALSSQLYSSTMVRFYQNDYLLFYTIDMDERKELNEVWDITESEFLHSKFCLHFGNFVQNLDMNGSRFDNYIVSDDRLLVSKGNLLLTYDISLTSTDSVSLAHAFVCNLTERASKSMIKEANSEASFFLSLQPNVALLQCGKFVVCSVRTDRRLHVWNIATGKKVADEGLSAPLQVMSINPMCYSDETKQVIVQMITADVDNNYFYYGYDLTKMGLGPFKLEESNCSHVLFATSTCVIGVHTPHIYSYNYKTSENMATKRFDRQVIPASNVVIVGDSLLCGSTSGTVFVMNPQTLLILNIVKTGINLSNLRPICNRFVVMNSTESQLWYIDKTHSRRLFKFPSGASLEAINKYGTKVALTRDNNIIILSFW